MTGREKERKKSIYDNLKLTYLINLIMKTNYISLDLTQERKKKSIVGYSRQTINHNCEIMI
jgi:hypothetical protein